jgi:hypothetical protein
VLAEDPALSVPCNPSLLQCPAHGVLCRRCAGVQTSAQRYAARDGWRHGSFAPATVEQRGADATAVKLEEPQSRRRERRPGPHGGGSCLAGAMLSAQGAARPPASLITANRVHPWEHRAPGAGPVRRSPG